MTVNNLSPAVEAGVNQTAAEGATVTVNATYTDAGAGDTHTATISWGDGVVQAGVVNQIADTVAGSHAYADNGSYTITVCVTDDDGATTCDTLIVGVTNVAPAVDAGPNQAVTEGDAVTLAATFTDPGIFDYFTSTVAWGDGTPVESSSLPTGSTAVNGSHVYADNGVYTVTVCVMDKDADQNCDAATVTVSNAVPTIVPSGGAETFEGTPVGVLLATFNDKGTKDTHTATVNWGDGSPIQAGAVSESPFGPPGSTLGADGSVFGSHLYIDDGVFTVTVTLTDDDGGSVATSLTITVRNTPPVVTLTGLSGTDENQTHTYSYTVHDAGDDTWTFAPGYPTCGLNGLLVPGSLTVAPNGGAFECHFPDGSFTSVVAVQAVDSDGEPSPVKRRHRRHRQRPPDRRSSRSFRDSRGVRDRAKFRRLR